MIINLQNPRSDEFVRELPGFYDAGEFPCFVFLEDSRWKSIQPYSVKYIHFKISSVIFQFRLEEFRKSQSLLLTSTAQDMFWFFLPNPSLDKMVRCIEKGNSQPSVKGWHVKGDHKKTSQKWGGYLLKKYDDLLEHKGNLDLSDEALDLIYQSLLKRSAYEI